jgi:aminoglycoside phosphotransferase (APT) family kinase protein
MHDDTIAVRADEGFDELALAAYLRGKLPGADNPLRVRQFGGGAANLTYLLDYGSDAYVLRRPPLGPVAKTAHDMTREYKVLSVLYRDYPSAPRAFHYCADPAIIGSDFLVMERRQGIVVRRAIPPPFAAYRDAPRRMSEAVVDALAAFHAVDYAALGLEDLGRPDGFVTRQIDGWYRRWQKARLHDLPEMEEVYAWLKENQPRAERFSLVHNDFKLDNVMLADDDPGRVVAVFDWDMCTLGDPLSDLGTLLTYWTERSDPPYLQAVAMMPVGDVGFMTRDELVKRYGEKSGSPVKQINFYHALGLFRLTVIIAQIYVRYRRGQTKDARFAAFETMIPLMARAAEETAAE